MVLTRTQLRRAEKKHTIECWKKGALQRDAHLLEASILETMATSIEARTILHSVAVHLADSSRLPYSCHLSSLSNLAAKQLHVKSTATYKGHQMLHQRANGLRHDACEWAQGM